MDRYYFDANATTPPLPEVLAAQARAAAEAWANPTSTHREGQRARHLLEEARRAVALELAVDPAHLVFCASATEALHLLLRGLQPRLGGLPAVVFPGEHSACLNPLRDWSMVRWLPCEAEGAATVVQMAASNETGIRYPMPQVPEAVRILDAVQAWGKVPLDLSVCDAAVLSGHKIGGPRGAALLWMRPDLPWTAVLEGPQERRRRGGTEDLPAIVGLAEAARAVGARVEANAALAALRDDLEAEVLGWSPDYEALGRGLPRLPNTSALLLRGHNGESVQIALDLAGFAVSTGSACHSGATRPSHAVTSLGYSAAEARSVIRVSMLPGTSREAVGALAGALKRVLKR
ncbi:cysteine desulfurase family protein [Mesoterricola silvestris]|uniref:cysteine desulfurase n=1 Tax=Mesoterricola silvestris TaxID=2927979 RepID=A0AA48GIN0_9BACT|nr:aminotransferase class V-fold PLP-dependent enzyme [Mesoterricola silvestris]BDU73661.1 aminotransferase [Mesoterricola silvestris]